MRQVDVRDPAAAALVVAALERGAVLLQLPTVYTLIAPPTRRGAAFLDATKRRRPGKNYGTLLGAVESFERCVDPESLPPEVRAERTLSLMEGAFVRCRFASPGTDTSGMRDGTHQGLILPDPWRSVARAVELAWGPRAEPDLFGGHRFSAPFCTSANRSGHPNGSIVDRRVALAFALGNGVELFVSCEDAPVERGSYPIFVFERDAVTVGREGPGLDRLADRLPARLRPALAA